MARPALAALSRAASAGFRRADMQRVLLRYLCLISSVMSALAQCGVAVPNSYSVLCSACGRTMAALIGHAAAAQELSETILLAA